MMIFSLTSLEQASKYNFKTISTPSTSFVEPMSNRRRDTSDTSNAYFLCRIDVESMKLADRATTVVLYNQTGPLKSKEDAMPIFLEY